jgi:crotonobetainyl-CoA:carnitine CoA-transferase CaiB-like acyl-CoA transferase
MREETLPAPRLGQHTREVLPELGYGEAEIAAMLDSGAAQEMT